MMRMRTKLTGLSPMNGNSTTEIVGVGRGVGGGVGGAVGGGGEDAPENCEVRPCGMLVQKRLDADQNTKPPPLIRVRVKYGGIYHEIFISSEASFGELKKMLTGPTGLHHEDQKLYYKDKERDSKQFLDSAGVKNKSKLVLMEDPISQEKRYLEMRRNAKMEKAAKSISQISLQVDKFAAQVASIESVILKGGRVAEKDVVSLIELLMNELIKLDAIVADGDVKLQRKMQVRRVQKYVEMLDVLKVKNSMPGNNGVSNGHPSNSIYTGNGKVQTDNQDRAASNVGKPPLPPKQQQQQQHQQQQQRHSIGHSPLRPQPPPPPQQQQQQQQDQSSHSTSGTVVTTQWETFESAPPLIPISSTPPKEEKPKFPWDFYE